MEAASSGPSNISLPPPVGDPAIHAAVAPSILLLAAMLRIWQYFTIPALAQFQTSPDESYYLRLGLAIARATGASSPEFQFMDPAYGYFVGVIFKVSGIHLGAVFLVQIAFDCSIVIALIVIGRQMTKPVSGITAALLYAVNPAAIMYSCSLLKETSVATLVAWWVVVALLAVRRRTVWAWLALGALSGLLVGIRSNWILLGFATVVFALLFEHPARDETVEPSGQILLRARRAGVAALGMAMALLPWSVRNFQSDGRISPLPLNGGVVLHQVYNAENPLSRNFIPTFVGYANPGEIWRGYSTEAARRAGHALTLREIDRYWYGEAWSYMSTNPGVVIQHVASKALFFMSNAEYPNNRFLREERLFSPVLRFLPYEPGVLLALALIGLLSLTRADRRWVLLGAPLGVAWVTSALYFAEDRFRFQASAVIAIVCGILANQMWRCWRDRDRRQLVQLFGGAAILLTISLLVQHFKPPPDVSLEHLIWRYAKAGRRADAHAVAVRAVALEPANSAPLEALAYLDGAEGRLDLAAEEYRRAIELRPQLYAAHFNLALVYLALHDRAAAAREARIAVTLNPDPTYVALLQRLTAGGAN